MFCQTPEKPKQTYFIFHIADLFHRMKYMERRGSGLRKIVSETEKLPGYTEAYKPEFSSTATDFRVILKNVNYIMCGASAHDTAHDAAHDTSVISKNQKYTTVHSK